MSDHDKPVIIVDEMAEVAIDDPTFAGMRSMNVLEDSYEEIVATLREAHHDRFHHAPPPKGMAIFDELANEVVLPHESEIRRLMTIVEEKIGCEARERKKLLRAVKPFLKSLRS